ncbi:helix-turn-helix transcriptional regulator [Stackebrandtia soli]|uniref:helix-turn-helix transcriptional regulator n=1 Tax=Stackebrandtia soli TaxID=1892856 RepID=UPI0039EB76D4
MGLEALGLSPMEATVYRVVAEHRTLPIADASALTGLPSTTIDNAVEALLRIGLLVTDPAKPGLLIASPPDLTGRTLLLERSRELHQARLELNALAARFRDVPSEDDPLVETLPGLSVSSRLSEVQSQAEREVLIIDAPPYLTVDDSNPMQIEQMATGVVYRTIYDRLALEAPGGLQRVAKFTAAGEQARLLDHTPGKMLIVDRSYAIIPQQRHIIPSRCGAFLIHQSPLLDVILSLFDILWLYALPIDDTPGGTGTDHSELSAEDSQLLLLLLSGFTDESICRQLGIAKRTVGRRVRMLMDRAGAETRMQLGFQAAQLGWIRAPWRASGLRQADILTASRNIDAGQSTG